MDKTLYLINSYDLNAAEVTQALSEIGNGNMLDGIRNIYFEGIDVCARSTFPVSFPDENTSIFDNKFVVGGLAFGAGIVATVCGQYLFKKLRKKNKVQLSDEPYVIVDKEQECNQCPVNP